MWRSLWSWNRTKNDFEDRVATERNDAKGVVRNWGEGHWWARSFIHFFSSTCYRCRYCQDTFNETISSWSVLSCALSSMLASRCSHSLYSKMVACWWHIVPLAIRSGYGRVWKDQLRIKPKYAPKPKYGHCFCFVATILHRVRVAFIVSANIWILGNFSLL